MLLQLPQRPWGAAASLPADMGKSASRVAVARDAFLSFDASPTPLSQLVRPIGQNSAAVNSAVASAAGRVVVDEYAKAPDGSYQLRTVATDLLRYLKQQNIRVCLVPDVASAGNPAYTSITGASKGIRQSTNEVLMVAPTAFGFNEQAAQDNSFMHTAQKAGEGSALTRKVRA